MEVDILNLKELIKRIFIPFYWTYSISKDRNQRGESLYYRDNEQYLSYIYELILVFYIAMRLTTGLHEANNPKGCILKSIGDVIITPMYALGCNIGKDRFEIRVN